MLKSRSLSLTKPVGKTLDAVDFGKIQNAFWKALQNVRLLYFVFHTIPLNQALEPPKLKF